MVQRYHGGTSEPVSSGSGSGGNGSGSGNSGNGLGVGNCTGERIPVTKSSLAREPFLPQPIAMQNRISAIANHPCFSWLILALPAPPLVIDFYYHERYYAEIMYESGLLATQLMVLALALSPLMHLLRSFTPAMTLLRWLTKRRRAIGVAAFCYAALHTCFYVRELASLELVWLELEELELATGWLAFAVLVVLAATSNKASMRLLGSAWKRLQRGAYFALIFTALHWVLIGQFLQEMAMWMIPLALIQIPRVIAHFNRGSQQMGRG